MVKREIAAKVHSLLGKFPVITVTGPRQSGKTTLIKSLGLDIPYVSLEDPDVRSFVQADPRGFLSNYPKGAILDEVQKTPELFSYLQRIVDESEVQFILSGSHNFLLMEQISQTLAGRTAIFKLLPFTLSEISSKYSSQGLEHLIFNGGYPRIFENEIEPNDFYPAYINTYVERDVRLIKNIKNLGAFTKFIKLLAGRIGQPLNFETLGNVSGVDAKTAKSWINLLEASYIIYLLKPHHANFNKRLTKSPKVYFYDTGLLCSLLGLTSSDQLTLHYLAGNLFENFIINEFQKHKFNSNKSYELFFWQNQQKKEIDLVIDQGGKLTAIEIKKSQTFNTSFFDNLKYWQRISGNTPDDSVLIYGGENNLQTSNGKVVAWKSISKLFQRLL